MGDDLTEAVGIVEEKYRQDDIEMSLGVYEPLSWLLPGAAWR